MGGQYHYKELNWTHLITFLLINGRKQHQAKVECITKGQQGRE